MRMSDLQSKKIISILSGKNIGNIIDAEVLEDGRIDALVIEAGKSFFSLNRDGDSKINWNDIAKIGEDVILVRKD